MRNDRAVLGMLENLSFSLRTFPPDLNALTTTSKFSIRIQLQKKQRMEELPLDTPAVHIYRS